MKEEGMLGDKSLAKRRHTQGVITSRVAMRMHEVLCGSHLLLLGTAKCLYMGQLWLLVVRNCLRLAVHAHAAMCLHVVTATA